MPGAERDLEIYLNSLEEKRAETIKPIDEMTEEEAMKFFQEIPF
jgi:hypothetical protein